MVFCFYFHLLNINYACDRLVCSETAIEKYEYNIYILYVTMNLYSVVSIKNVELFHKITFVYKTFLFFSSLIYELRRIRKTNVNMSLFRYTYLF